MDDIVIRAVDCMAITPSPIPDVLEQWRQTVHIRHSARERHGAVKLSRRGCALTLAKNIPMQLCVWYDEFMPTVLRIGAFRFHFYTDEGSEPPHIHVRTPDGDCKFWLEPSIFLASNRGVRSHDLRQIERLVFDNEQELKKAYYERHPR